MSNRSHRSARGSPFSSLLGSGMAAIRPSSRPAMGVQWHVPTTNSTPPSSFALFAECAREREGLPTSSCVRRVAPLSFKGPPAAGRSETPPQVGRGRGWPVKMTKRGEKGNGREREGESEKGNGGGDGVSNNASFMVLLCCVRKQIIECGAAAGPGCGIKFARVRPRVTNRGEERERAKRRASVESETGIELRRRRSSRS